MQNGHLTLRDNAALVAEALPHVGRIVAASSDWTVKEQIEAEFESLEQACRLIAACNEQ